MKKPAASLFLFLVSVSVAIGVDQPPMPVPEVSREAVKAPETLPSPINSVPGNAIPGKAVPLEAVPPAYPVPHHKMRKYSIKYWHHPTLHGICCGRCTAKKIVFLVSDPHHAMVEVPVRVPECCNEIGPRVSTGRDIFHRFSYTYEWRSGYKVDVVFRPRGDIIVHTWGG